MNKLLIVIAAVASVFACGCSSKAANDNAAAPEETVVPHRVLVAYFSATGTTKAVAEDIAKATDATLYEITPDPRYTDADLDWRDKQSRSSIEMQDTACRPAIVGDPLDIAPYDIVFVGYPIWWDLAPRQVNTFLEKYDFAGKTIIPFATSGGSSITNSEADLKKLYPQYSWRDGKLLNDLQQVAPWAKEQVK